MVGLLNAFAIVSGILSLPFFVGNEVLLALKTLLDGYGVPEILSLALLLGGFFGALAVAYRRLMPFFLGPRDTASRRTAVAASTRSS